MCYNNYDEWVHYIEKKYNEFDEKRAVGGFRAWFKKSASSNKTLYKELDLLQKTKRPEVSLMMATVAVIFDSSLYNGKKHTAKSRDDNLKQTRYSSGAFYQAIKLAWDNDELQIRLPNDKDQSTFYWFEVVTALQKRFGIFNSLDDLNEFISSAGNKAVDDSEWGIYGLYIRDIHQLCLVYSILHGYSISEYKQLLNDCNDAVTAFTGDPQQTATVEVIRGTFDKYLRSPFCDDKTGFLQTVIINSDKLLNISGLHAQTIKEIYNRVYYLRTGIAIKEERRKESKKDGYYTEYIINLCSLLHLELEEFTSMHEKREMDTDFEEENDGLGNEDDIDELDIEDKIHELRKELAHRFDILRARTFNKNRKKRTDVNIDKLRDEYQKDGCKDFAYFNRSNIESADMEESNWFKRFMFYLRYYLIALSMKKLSCDKKSTNALVALKFINKQLLNCNFRPILNLADGDNTIETEMKDVFDWFVVNALKLEELINPKIGSPISGYRTFMKYVYNRDFQEHKA